VGTKKNQKIEPLTWTPLPTPTKGKKDGLSWVQIELSWDA